MSLFWSQEMMDRSPDSPPQCLAAVCVVNRRAQGWTLLEEQKASRETFPEGQVGEHVKEEAGFHKNLGVKCHC